MPISRKRKIYSALTFGSTFFQIFYSYFMFIADQEALNELTNNNAEGLVITLCILLSIFDTLDSLLLVDPSELAYKLTDGKEQNLTENHTDSTALPIIQQYRCLRIMQDYPLKWLTVLAAGTTFLIKASADSIPVGTWTNNQVTKFVLATPVVTAAIIYLTLLLWPEYERHHEYIYTRLLAKKPYILSYIIKSPLIALELLLTTGINSSLQAILFSYSSIKAKNTFFPGNENNRDLNIGITVFSSLSIGYCIIFTRYLDSQALYNTQHSNKTKQNLKKSWLLHAFLRIMRSTGFTYLTSKYLRHGSTTSIIGSSLLGFFLLNHSVYIAYKRASNQKNSNTEQPDNHSKLIPIVASIINAGSRTGTAIANYASIYDINQQLDLGFNRLDLVMFTLCFATSSAINDFDLFNKLITKSLTNYTMKFSHERKHHRFGIFGIFRSIEEYKETDKDMPLLLSPTEGENQAPMEP